MPSPVTQANTIKAINETLAIMDPVGTPILNLNTNDLSSPEWSCNNFSPALLDKICSVIGVPIDSINSVLYANGNQLPDNFANNTFVNISMMGNPSDLNHNFNILISGDDTYLIQTFVGRSVNIVRRFNNQIFINNWHALGNNGAWQAAYQSLFGVNPSDVIQNPPQASWLQEQYVSI